MQRLAIILAAAGLLSLILPPAAPADEVYLKNGNHLSGSIVSMSAGKLVLDTDFAGRLSIDWDHVERLFSDAPVTLVLLDGSTIRGVPVPADTPGLLRLTAEAGAGLGQLAGRGRRKIRLPLHPVHRVRVLNKRKGRNAETLSAFQPFAG